MILYGIDGSFVVGVTRHADKEEFEVGDAPICHVVMRLSEVTCHLILQG